MSKTIVVTGARGFVGSHLVPALLEAGYNVRCLSRRPDALSVPPSVEIVKADIFNPEELKQALAGAFAAYYFVHSMEINPRVKGSFDERDQRAAGLFARAAEEAGLARIIYLGGLGEVQDKLSAHLRSRLKVGQILQAGKVPTTIFRAAIIIGPQGASFRMIETLVRRLPVMICPKWVNTPCQPISIEDVVYYLVAALKMPNTAGKTLDIGGPDILTYYEMMMGLARVMKKKRLMIRVPLLTPRLSSYWVKLVTPVPVTISRPLIDGLKNPVVCRDHSVKTYLPHTCLSYQESLRRTLKQEGTGTIKKMGGAYHLYWRQWVPHSPDKVMRFLGNLENLVKMTPSHLNFTLVPPVPKRLQKGTHLHYRLKILGVSLKWRSEIVEWVSPRQFIDDQLEGPYKRWHHTHTITAEEGGCLIEDSVEYQIPFGIFGKIVHPLFVKPTLRRIFRHRSRMFPVLLGHE